jgi:hypothetical protein
MKEDIYNNIREAKAKINDEITKANNIIKANYKKPMALNNRKKHS